ncbi:conserved hypothetical protein [Candidatus Desulfarcum epimagneticum]|uniref:Uncharacterized protein n=1 Tax=uncultured Desulfobacteraceae bacterium TaxID=218296 RepID=A0A484HHJ0_9BACT|nr:conserved hypothetical protein [uncultured Desulfobacteraceae bacterium]
MIARNRLKTEIDQLDDRHVELLYRIVRRLSHASGNTRFMEKESEIEKIFQQIADDGGLGIEAPVSDSSCFALIRSNR